MIQSDFRNEKGQVLSPANELSNDVRRFLEQTVYPKYKDRLSYDAINSIVMGTTFTDTTMRIMLESHE